MKRHVITLTFLALALVLYTLGAAGPATGLLVLGVLAEGVFWFRLVRGGRKQRRS